MPNLIPVLPEIFMLSMICITLLVDLFIPKNLRIITFILTLLTLLGAFIISTVLYTYTKTYVFNGMYVHDQIASLLKIIIYIVSAFAFVYAREYIKERDIPEGEFYILGLFSVLGMMVLVSANSLLVIFLGLELTSLPQYTMIALHRKSSICSEAAIKYFVLGATASAILLYGMSLLYGAANSIDLLVIAKTVANLTPTHQYIAFFALVFLVVGVVFKLGGAPFHNWVPDAYQGAPTPVTLFIGSAPKVAALGMMIRLLVEAVPSLDLQWQHLLIAIALLSMAIGNIVAIVQTNIKRMLAYSSIAHMGYMLLGILTANALGYAASIFYIISYAIMAIGAFAIVVLLSRSNVEAENIVDLRGLNKRSPWLALIMLFLMFSMAGIPPTLGFFAKLGVFLALVKVHLVWLAAVALIFAVIGSYYYLAIVKVMYFEEPTATQPILMSWDMRLAISINGLAVLILGIFPTALIDLCRAAVY